MSNKIKETGPKVTGSISKDKRGVSKLEMNFPEGFGGSPFPLGMGDIKREPPIVDFDKLQPVEELINELRDVLQGRDWNVAYNAVNAIQSMLQLSIHGTESFIVPPMMRKGPY